MSFPNKLIAGLTHRGMKAIWENVDKQVVPMSLLSYEADLFQTRDTIEGLHKIGFRTNKGYKDSGLLLTVWHKAGGYYLGTRYPIEKAIEG